MNTVLNFVEKPLASLAIGAFIGLAGIAISLVLYMHGKRQKRVSYIIIEVTIVTISNDTWKSELDIKYRGVDVGQLTAARVGIWNSGNTVLYGSETVCDDPLQIYVDNDEKLLQAQEHGMSNKYSKISVHTEHSKGVISFDYLDPGDGFVIHAATSEPVNSLLISGTMRGLPSGFSKVTANSLDALGTTLNLAAVLALGAIAGPLVRAIRESLLRLLSIDKNSTGATWIAISLLLIWIVGSIYLGNVIARRTRNLGKIRRLPKVIRDDPVIATSLGLKVKPD